MNTNDADSSSDSHASSDEPAENGAAAENNAAAEQPTEPLPWWAAARPDSASGDTMPLTGGAVPVAGDAAREAGGTVPVAGDTVPMAADTVPMAGGAVPVAGGAVPVAGGTVPVTEVGSVAAPVPAGAGRAVTDSMKAAQPERPSFLRRHLVGLSIAAAALAIVVVAGGTAWGVSAAIAGGDSAAPAAMNTAVHAKKGANAAKQKHGHGTVGTVTAMSGGTWTLQSAAGATVTVNVGSATEFGTAKKPANASSFAVGDRVGVIGARTGDSVTATRIVHLAATKHGTNAQQGATATPTPTPNT